MGSAVRGRRRRRLERQERAAPAPRTPSPPRREGVVEAQHRHAVARPCEAARPERRRPAATGCRARTSSGKRASMRLRCAGVARRTRRRRSSAHRAGNSAVVRAISLGEPRQLLARPPSPSSSVDRFGRSSERALSQPADRLRRGAASVIRAPASMRAISSRRSAGSSPRPSVACPHLVGLTTRQWVVAAGGDLGRMGDDQHLDALPSRARRSPTAAAVAPPIPASTSSKHQGDAPRRPRRGRPQRQQEAGQLAARGDASERARLGARVGGDVEAHPLRAVGHQCDPRQGLDRGRNRALSSLQRRQLGHDRACRAAGRLGATSDSRAAPARTLRAPAASALVARRQLAALAASMPEPRREVARAGPAGRRPAAELRAAARRANSRSSTFSSRSGSSRGPARPFRAGVGLLGLAGPLEGRGRGRARRGAPPPRRPRSPAGRSRRAVAMPPLSGREARPAPSLIASAELSRVHQERPLGQRRLLARVRIERVQLGRE